MTPWLKTLFIAAIVIQTAASVVSVLVRLDNSANASRYCYPSQGIDAFHHEGHMYVTCAGSDGALLKRVR